MLRGRHSRVVRVGSRAVKVFIPDFNLNFWKEVYFLRELQPYGFVPRLYSYNAQKLEIVMEFIEGDYIKDFEFKSSEEWRVLERCFNACRLLDKLKIQKEEMHRPNRHIIVRNGVPYFVDFERAHYSKRPSNVTQFAIYAGKRLGICFEEIKEILRRYKAMYDEKSFKELLTRLAKKVK